MREMGGTKCDWWRIVGSGRCGVEIGTDRTVGGTTCDRWVALSATDGWHEVRLVAALSSVGELAFKSERTGRWVALRATGGWH